MRSFKSTFEVTKMSFSTIEILCHIFGWLWSKEILVDPETEPLQAPKEFPLLLFNSPDRLETWLTYERICPCFFSAINKQYSISSTQNSLITMASAMMMMINLNL